MNVLELFAGAGGGILGGMLLGHRCVCAVEYDAYARSVLLARQNDGTFPPFPVWDDVRTFNGRPWRGIVDVVSGGFPCQDISVAGSGAGLDGERSGLWKEMAWIIWEVRPRFVFIENSPALITRGLDRVLSDLAAMGFACRWGVVSAADTGAHHRRERIWILAYSASIGQQGSREQINPISQAENRKRKASNAFDVRKFREWPLEPRLGRVVNGMANRSHRLKAIGNGQVPRVHAAAWELLYGNKP